MILRRIFVLVLACGGLAACTTGYGEKIDVSTVRSFKLERVDVSVAPDATFWWGDGERAYARSIGRSEQEAATLGASVQGRAYMRAKASQHIKAAFDRELAGRLAGSRPVRVVVIMHDVQVASAVPRVLVGGGHRMRATASLVDARTGQVIASNPNLTISAAAGQGVLGAVIDPAFGDPIDRLSGNLAQSYRTWLLPAG